VRRTTLLIVASAVAMLGWGTVLPYQYAYAATTRGWGALVAALASSLFSVGALAAAPIGGRLADRYPAALVAVVAKVAAAVAAWSLVAAQTPTAFLLGMSAFGFALAASGPAQSVLVLRWVPSGDRRTVFAWLASGQALGMGLGAFAAGFLVDLHRVDGMTSAFATAAGGFALSALLIAVAARGVNDLTSPPLAVPVARGDTARAVRGILASPTLRWAGVLTIALALAFYAQFDSGLPAYALTVLDVSERTVGTAAAVNCAVILLLQMAVVKWTARSSAPGLLMLVGSIWLLCWVILGLAAHQPQIAAAVFVTTFGIFAVGETMYAPVLNPLVAQLAPPAHVGTTLGIFAALQTGVSAAGPLVAGVALGSGHALAFVAIHVGISAVAVLAAQRLQHQLTRPSEHPLTGPSVGSDRAGREGPAEGGQRVAGGVLDRAAQGHRVLRARQQRPGRVERGDLRRGAVAGH
jgi:MFS family permease